MNRWRDCIIQTGVAQLFVACGVVLFGSAASAATDTQIAYFETLSFAQPSTGASNKSGPDAAVSSLQFEAFGRNFILNLQQNPRFAAIAQKLQADTSRQVLQGQLQGDANSWVRLTRVHSRWHGMSCISSSRRKRFKSSLRRVSPWPSKAPSSFDCRIRIRPSDKVSAALR